jgi:hypothetical protein
MFAHHSPAYAPAPAAAPARPEVLRSCLLKKPLSESMGEAPKSPILPSRFR